MLVAASKIPLMAAFALPAIGGLAAVVFGLLGLGWPTLFDRPNDRFAANLYAMIAASIMIICFAGGKHLHDDWPGYLIALFAIPIVPMLTKRRLGPRPAEGLDQLPKGQWAQPVIAQRTAKPSAPVSTPVKSKGPGVVARLMRRPRALAGRSQALLDQRPPSQGKVVGSSVERSTKSALPAPVTAVRAKASPSKPPRAERGAALPAAPAKRDITSIDVLPAPPPAPGKPTTSPARRQAAAGRPRTARSAGAAAPGGAIRKTPTTLIIPELPEATSSGAVTTIRPMSKVEAIAELPERPQSWTNLMVGNITLEDGRSYSIAVRSTQTINENEIRKLAKAS